MKKENVMACILMESTDEQLINKGLYLTNLFNSQLIVLYLYQNGEKKSDEETQMKKLAVEFGVQFISQSYDDKADKVSIILKNAKQHHVTQILIGQYCQSRWEIIKKGDFINRLIKHSDNIDLRIVSMENEAKKGSYL